MHISFYISYQQRLHIVCLNREFYYSYCNHYHHHVDHSSAHSFSILCCGCGCGFGGGIERAVGLKMMHLNVQQTSLVKLNVIKYFRVSYLLHSICPPFIFLFVIFHLPRTSAACLSLSSVKCLWFASDAVFLFTRQPSKRKHIMQSETEGCCLAGHFPLKDTFPFN